MAAAAADASCSAQRDGVGKSIRTGRTWCRGDEILNAYAIVFAALLVPAGRLADRYGVKPGLLLGLALFAAGSLGCALSSDLWLIVGLRCLQALGAAALVPTSLGLILTAIPAERRQSSIGIWAISGSLGAAAGPALGGLLVALSWRWIFVINVPISVAAFIAIAALAPHVRHHIETIVPDVLGGALLVVAIGALALALVQTPDWGWGADSTLASFAVAVVAFGLFVLRSARHPAAIVQLDLFRNRAFAWANLANFLLGVSFAAQLLGLVLWLQEDWGWSALQTGLAIAPGPVMLSVTAWGLRRYTSALPAGLVAATGALLMGAGGALIAVTLTTDGSYAAEILPGWMIIGGGAGLAIPALVSAATAGLAPHQTSTGSAIVQMGRQIGSALGVSLLIIILGTAMADAGTLDRFTRAWWWAGLLSLAAAFAALPITARRARPTNETRPGTVNDAAVMPPAAAARDDSTVAFQSRVTVAGGPTSPSRHSRFGWPGAQVTLDWRAQVTSRSVV